jgi:hypothetical protein
MAEAFFRREKENQSSIMMAYSGSPIKLAPADARDARRWQE